MFLYNCQIKCPRCFISAALSVQYDTKVRLPAYSSVCSDNSKVNKPIYIIRIKHSRYKRRHSLMCAVKLPQIDGECYTDVRRQRSDISNYFLPPLLLSIPLENVLLMRSEVVIMISCMLICCMTALEYTI